MGGIPLECRNAIIHIYTRTKMAEFDKYQNYMEERLRKTSHLGRVLLLTKSQYECLRQEFCKKCVAKTFERKANFRI